MAGWNPKMLSVAVPNTAGGTQLSALIAAAGTNKDTDFTTRLSMLILEMDLGSTGNIYVGNKVPNAVSATNCGLNLVPGVSRTISPGVNGMILTTDIWVLATVNNAQLNIIAQPITM